MMMFIRAPESPPDVRRDSDTVLGALTRAYTSLVRYFDGYRKVSQH
jgi:hypothetical protein